MTVTVDEFEVADPADAWTRAGFSVDIDGVPTKSSNAPAAAPAAHPNGVIAIDHVVVLSLFFRFGEVIVEVVGSPDTASDAPSTLWGITYVVTDIDATASFFGDRTTPVKDAVQPGRRITTLRHQEFGMSVRSAMISGLIVGA